MELLPFGGLKIVTTITDEKYIEALLDESGKKTLHCSVCGSTSFEVEAVVKTNLDISVGRPEPKILIREKRSKSAMLLTVIECATCKASDFYVTKNEDKEP